MATQRKTAYLTEVPTLQGASSRWCWMVSCSSRGRSRRRSRGERPPCAAQPAPGQARAPLQHRLFTPELRWQSRGKCILQGGVAPPRPRAPMRHSAIHALHGGFSALTWLSLAGAAAGQFSLGGARSGQREGAAGRAARPRSAVPGRKQQLTLRCTHPSLPVGHGTVYGLCRVHPSLWGTALRM